MSFDTAAWIGWPLKYQPMRIALAHLLTDENLQTFDALLISLSPP
jgi:hypothetical protein